MNFIKIFMSIVVDQFVTNPLQYFIWDNKIFFYIQVNKIKTQYLYI